MYLLYGIAVIPAVIGAVLYMCKKEVVWLEWLGSAVIGLIIAGIMHIVVIRALTDDTEVWSGQVVRTDRCPAWVEEYQERHTSTYYTGSGKNRTAHTRVWYTTEHDHHPEHWVAALNFGTIDEDKEIGLEDYNKIKGYFGNSVVNGGTQSYHHGGHFDGGDNKIYSTPNNTGYLYPATTLQHFENRVKAAPTLFSFAKVPEGTPVFGYPKNENWVRSDRLLGTAAKTVDILEFDRMNSRLGPRSKVNIILVGFDNGDSQLGCWQEAKFVGGKKNDLVLCYGGTTNVVWAKCFGWTEKMNVKRNLETMILGKVVNTVMLSSIEDEIKKSYVIKQWDKFSYIQIEPPWWAYLVEIILMAIAQVIYWYWAFNNNTTKDGGSMFRYDQGWWFDV